MLKLKTINGVDALTYSLQCGCAVTGLFKHADAKDTADALVAFAHAVAGLEAVHEFAHGAAAADRGQRLDEVVKILRDAGFPVEAEVKH